MNALWLIPGALAAVLALRDWRFATLLLAAALPFEGLLGTAGLSGMKVLTVLAALAAALHVLRDPALLGRLRANLGSDLSLGALALVLLAATSMLWAVSPAEALAATISFTGVFVLLHLFALLDRDALRRAWAVLLASATLSVPAGWLGLGALSDEGRFAAGGHNPNDYAGLLVIVLFVAGLGRAWATRTLRIAAMLAVLGGVLWTGSRTGLVALLLAPLLFLWLCAPAARRRAVRQAAAAYGAAGVAVVALLAFDAPQARALQERAATLTEIQDDRTWAGRLAIWRGGWDLFLERPMHGAGAGNFPVVATGHTAIPRGSQDARRGAVAHSVVLGTAVELGVIGVAALAFVAWRAFRRARAASAESVLGSGLLLGLLGWLVIGSTLSWEHAKVGYVLLGSLLALTPASAREAAA